MNKNSYMILKLNCITARYSVSGLIIIIVEATSRAMLRLS